MSEKILDIDQKISKDRSGDPTKNRDACKKEFSAISSDGLQPQRDSQLTVEILVEGQECPFCHFAKLKREGDEIVCPICGYGRKPST